MLQHGLQWIVLATTLPRCITTVINGHRVHSTLRLLDVDVCIEFIAVR